MNDVTDILQPDGFFMRPFSINLPYKTTNSEGKVTGWWENHDENLGATYGKNRQLMSMMWHPILQVPTNLTVTVARPAASGTNEETRVELHLPRAVHPNMLNLTGFAKDDTAETRDRLRVVATKTDTVRGTLHCTPDGTWEDASGDTVATNYIQADDTLVFESVAVSGQTNWNWKCPTVIQDINGTVDYYNLLSLNLPVAVHPTNLCLVAVEADGKTPVTNAASMKMYASDDSRSADKLYVVDTKTKQVRGNSMLYCDSSGIWRFVSNDSEVQSRVIHPNDMLILQSGKRPSGAPVRWTWSYAPGDFYTMPDRHMGRTQ